MLLVAIKLPTPFQNKAMVLHSIISYNSECIMHHSHPMEPIASEGHVLLQFLLALAGYFQGLTKEGSLWMVPV